MPKMEIFPIRKMNLFFRCEEFIILKKSEEIILCMVFAQ